MYESHYNACPKAHDRHAENRGKKRDNNSRDQKGSQGPKAKKVKKQTKVKSEVIILKSTDSEEEMVNLKIRQLLALRDALKAKKKRKRSSEVPAVTLKESNSGRSKCRTKHWPPPQPLST